VTDLAEAARLTAWHGPSKSVLMLLTHIAVAPDAHNWTVVPKRLGHGFHGRMNEIMLLRVVCAPLVIAAHFAQEPGTKGRLLTSMSIKGGALRHVLPCATTCLSVSRTKALTTTAIASWMEMPGGDMAEKEPFVLPWAGARVLSPSLSIHAQSRLPADLVCQKQATGVVSRGIFFVSFSSQCKAAWFCSLAGPS
jgi:hypothetical protein